MRLRAWVLCDAGALINVRTNSFIFFINANQRCARKTREMREEDTEEQRQRFFIIFVVFSSKTIISSSRNAFSSRNAPLLRMSTNRYSLKANPDKPVHSLYLTEPLDRFCRFPHVLSEVFAHYWKQRR